MTGQSSSLYPDCQRSNVELYAMLADLPLPDAPTRQLSEHEPSGSSSNNADAGDTSMPTEVLRHLGESSQKDPALQEESPGMKALRSVALSNEWDTSAVSWSDLRTVIQNQIEQVRSSDVEVHFHMLTD